MLKEFSLRKILITTTALFSLFLIYFIPKSDNDISKDLKQELSYVNSEVIKSNIYLLDDQNYLGLTQVVVSTNKHIETLAKELLTVLISGGAGESKVPNGFKSVLPVDTKILSMKYENGLFKVDFSKELLDTKKEYEEKIVEAIVYTLTEIPEIKNVIIYVEGNVLSKLPQTGIILPSTLNRDFGINKYYDFFSLKDIIQVNAYYINKNSSGYYYVPVTNYINDNREKIEIVIENMTSSNILNTNLMSFLKSNAKLLAVEKKNDLLELTFNNYLFNDFDTKDILEEVIYTISLSIKDNYDVSKVVFKVENQEICEKVLKPLE